MLDRDVEEHAIQRHLRHQRHVQRLESLARASCALKLCAVYGVQSRAGCAASAGVRKRYIAVIGAAATCIAAARPAA